MALEIKKFSNQHIETNKQLAPFLLAASFQELISFNGHYLQNGILHWVFSPKDKAEILIDQLQTKTEPHIPALDLFSAIDTFWEKISKYKKLLDRA